MNILALFKPIKTFVFDVDGVLSSGMILLFENETARTTNIKDGFGLQLAIKQGYRVLIISGGQSKAVKERFEGLGIKDIFLGVHHKREILTEYVQQHNLKWEEVLFMGDDIPDYQAMQLVGLPCCPADAVNEIKQIARYISPLNGGQGCGRDVIEKVLKLNGHWDLDTGIASK
ncbi:HAD-IIIA family hydrolase [soil metagenome]|jgi:3-deoxy-D-manno-octulosonate 8-phosphate phosphatase (KDO 8-P phosphatase)